VTDELDALRKALKAAPAPDAARRAETLAAAMVAFDAHQAERTQETAIETRPMKDRPVRAGFLQGVLGMLNQFSTRAVMGATVSAAAVIVGLAVVMPVLRDTKLPPLAPQTHVGRTDAPVADAPVAEPAPAPSKTEAPATTRPLVAAMPDAGATVAPTAASPLDTSAGADALAQTAPQPTAPPPTVDVTGVVAPESKAAMATGTAVPGQAAPLAKEARSQAEADLGRARAFADSTAQEYNRSADGEAFAGGLAAAPMPLEEAPALLPEPNTEAFPDASPNPVKVAAEEPVSTFSTDVDTASWSVVRSSLMAGYLPPADAVRIEEMVNYFPYAYPAPEATGAPFRPTVSVMPTPWNANTELLRIGIQGRLPAIADRPPLNLVFLIDTSGSMEDANKLPLLKQSLSLMLGKLRPEDRVAIVTYAGSAGEVLEPTEAKDRAKIMAALDNLSAGGSTAGAEGIALAYQVAKGMQHDNAVTRVLLATDGDFNVGIDDPEQLKDFIATERKSGVYLSVLGFGRGNLDDATMQALAQNGNGTAAYIDTLSEAQKVLVDQLTGALFPIADDVKVQVEFNPAQVAEYRLIGYETRALRREDFNNDRVDAGEIGAGLQVTALYEVTPVGSPAILNDALRYGASATTAAPADMSADAKPAELGFLKLRWKAPGAATSQLIEQPIAAASGDGDADFRFAAAVAGMGQILTGATYLGDWGWDDAIKLANGAKGDDPYGYRAEAVQMMRLGQSLSR
jgi:Ca-activated chloride channel family protein